MIDLLNHQIIMRFYADTTFIMNIWLKSSKINILIIKILKILQFNIRFDEINIHLLKSSYFYFIKKFIHFLIFFFNLKIDFLNFLQSKHRFPKPHTTNNQSPINTETQTQLELNPKITTQQPLSGWPLSSSTHTTSVSHYFI